MRQMGQQMGPFGAANNMLVYSNPFNQRIAAAWHEGTVVHFLDLGEPDISPGGQALNPIYFIITGFDHQGTPVLVQGQYCVLSHVPGQPGYSQFHKVLFVEVPAAYMPNSIRSEADIRLGGFPVLESDMALCAAVL